MRRRTVRITPLGYIVLSIIIGDLVGFYFLHLVDARLGQSNRVILASARSDYAEPSLATVSSQRPRPPWRTTPAGNNECGRRYPTMTPIEGRHAGDDVKTPFPRRCSPVRHAHTPAALCCATAGGTYTILGKYLGHAA